ncbi:RNA polymerase sigma factor [Nocardioides taihuensis]|uniref:RNA polymerase sigma factor n=1 Tax=Nocardioides taihuensis TaxID=1835606 RepID=A0ABW0BLU6_9ACTN
MSATDGDTVSGRGSAAGDDASSEARIRELYAASYRRLLGQLIGVTGSVREAEDVVQEAFVRGLERPGRLLDLDNPEAWLRTVAVNLARRRWRRAQRFRGLAPRLVEEPRLVDHASAGETSGSDQHLVLLAALRRLPAGEREAIALHHLADLSVEDVAATLGVPPGTVKSRLSRGRAALGQLLVAEEGPHV